MTTTKPEPARRMGPPGSENWHAMLDGAEDILREEGHAELTSRRIAERIGVKQRLVYYYFHTMDDLVVALFRRLSERELKRLRDALNSPHSLREMWNTNVGSTDARLISEFMALANRIADLRAEVIHFIEESRDIEIEAIEAAVRRKANSNAIPPAALAILASSVALSLSRERQLGVSSGHEVVLALIDAFLDEVDD
ncbi:TetR/AcrR family transcriptional regulator [Novosphingobium endophyticum]|nr:TetR/AcrR family transcriptional regulator [Novosphingobium endophyticum]